MHDPKQQIEDVNHFDNTVVVKFQDGVIALLKGDEVRQAKDISLKAEKIGGKIEQVSPRS